MTKLGNSLIKSFDNGAIWDSFDKHLMSLLRFANEPSFPYYDVVKVGSDNTSYEIRLALAGYTRENIEVEQKDLTLTISAKKVETVGEGPTDTETFLHRGISKAEFTRSFRLPVDAVVRSATMRDGILTVAIDLPKKQDRTVKIAVE